jgi:hypothetical protein
VPAPPRAPEPVAGPATARGRAVFECVIDGVRTFSQTACGASSALREVHTDTMNTYRHHYYAVPRPEPVLTPGYAPAGEDGLAPDLSARQGAPCSEIETAIRSIDERMRHPYGNREGNYYRGRRHALVDELYDLQCGR